MASDKTPLLRPSSAPVSAEEEESYFLRRFAPLWCRRKAVQLTACDSEDNTSDINTKPLTGALFVKHRASLLGLLN